MSRRMSAGTEFMDIIDEGKERGREVRPAQQRGESELKVSKGKHGASYRCRFWTGHPNSTTSFNSNYYNHDIVLYT